MGLEIANWIGELIPANPLVADPVGQGDDHLRLVKTVLANTFVGEVGDLWDSTSGALLVGPAFLTSLKGLSGGTYPLTLANEQFLTGRNVAGDGNINLLKVNLADQMEFGTGVALAIDGEVFMAQTLFANGGVFGDLTGAVLTAPQPNITSVGTLDSLAVTGAITSASLTATGDITAFSDVRLKDDISFIPNALAKVLSLGGYEYARKDLGGMRSAGLIAQEVRKVLPEAVKEHEGGFLSVNYNATIALLVEAVKELAYKVEPLR